MVRNVAWGLANQGERAPVGLLEAGFFSRSAISRMIDANVLEIDRKHNAEGRLKKKAVAPFQ